MNGFISESTSKISDGFGTAISILALYFSTRFLDSLVVKTSGRPGELVYVLILLIMGVLMLARALTPTRQEEQRADAGLTAGVILWQVTAFGNLFGNAGFAGVNGWFFWLMAFVVMIVLWRKVLPTGLRGFLLVYLLLWAGWLYTNALAFISGWASAFIVVYHLVRTAALIGVLVFIWVIVYRTSNTLQRKLCGVGLAFCVLLGLNLF